MALAEGAALGALATAGALAGTRTVPVGAGVAARVSVRIAPRGVETTMPIAVPTKTTARAAPVAKRRRADAREARPLGITSGASV